jgi:hypothetical protein
VNASRSLLSCKRELSIKATVLDGRSLQVSRAKRIREPATKCSFHDIDADAERFVRSSKESVSNRRAATTFARICAVWHYCGAQPSSRTNSTGDRTVTDYPTAAWTAQQLREAFPWNEHRAILCTIATRRFTPGRRQRCQ